MRGSQTSQNTHMSTKCLPLAACLTAPLCNRALYGHSPSAHVILLKNWPGALSMQSGAGIQLHFQFLVLQCCICFQTFHFSLVSIYDDCMIFQLLLVVAACCMICSKCYGCPNIWNFLISYQNSCIWFGKRIRWWMYKIIQMNWICSQVFVYFSSNWHEFRIGHCPVFFKDCLKKGPTSIPQSMLSR